MSEIEELRDKVEALERRIERLEEQDDADRTETKENGLDHRDMAVLARVEEMGRDPGPRGTKQLYKRETDVRQDKTAIERAKTLRNKEAFAEAVEA